jgi:hypothetical protein
VSPRATWVWGRPRPQDLISWVLAHRVGEIFVGVRLDCNKAADLPWLRSVVERAHANGVRVAALGGDQGWVGDAEPALAWRGAVLDTGLFDRVHIDVKVWARDDWKVRPVELGIAYTELLRRLADDGSLHLEADIAFHLHKVAMPSGESLESAVMGMVDAVTVLSYRNTVTGVDSITDVAASALHTAARLDIPCRLAVETKYLGRDPVHRKQTFHGLGKPALNRALDAVDRAKPDVDVYAGIAVHDYEHWRTL